MDLEGSQSPGGSHCCARRLVEPPVGNSPPSEDLPAWVRTKRTEAALDEWKGRLVDQTKDLFAVASFDGYFKHVNAAWLPTLGYTPEEVLAVPYESLIMEEDREPTRRVADNLSEGETVLRFRNRYLTKAGGFRWLDWTAVPDMPAELIYCVAHDVTEQVALEEVARLSEQRLRLILKMAISAVIEATADGVVTDWNDSAEQIFGWTREEMLGRSIAETIVPPRYREAHTRGIRHFAQTGEGPVLGQTLEIFGLHKDGREFPLELSISPVSEERGTSVIAFARDITARKRAEEDLLASRSEAKRLDGLKSEFVAFVSHEFRNGLVGIQGFSDIMRTEVLSEAEVREYAADINNDALRLNRMITEMLDLDRIESGRMALQLSEIDILELIAAAVERALASTSKHRISVQGEQDLPRISADSDRLTQVITNLLSNAVKYSPDGGDITVSVGSDESAVHIAIEDHGLGIPAAFLSRIFERYERYERRATDQITGTGLGLPIARKIVELHGGSVAVESREGQGSVFTIHLPIARGVEAIGT